MELRTLLILAVGMAAGSRFVPQAAAFVYEAAPPRTVVDLNVPLRLPDRAAGAAFQFGPGKGDVLHIVLDAPRPDAQHDTAWFHAPGLSVTGNLVRVRGARDPQGTAYECPPLHAVFGGTGVTYQCRFISLTRHEESEVRLLFTVEVRAGCLPGNTACQFELRGETTAGLNPRAPLEPMRWITRPELRIRWRQIFSAIRLEGSLRMGEVALFPRSGMDSRCALVVRANRKLVFRDRLPLVPHTWHDYFSYEPRRTLRRGIPHVAEASYDAGPLWGELKASSTGIFR